MKVSTEIDNNFGYEKITQLVDNIPLIQEIKLWALKFGIDSNNTSYLCIITWKMEISNYILEKWSIVWNENHWLNKVK